MVKPLGRRLTHLSEGEARETRVSASTWVSIMGSAWPCCGRPSH